MKKRILVLMLFIVAIANAQISSLNDLASGELKMFTPISELDGSIYGYFNIYKLEDVSETEEKYEYVLLDKNLNSVANGEFIDVKYKGYDSDFYYPEKIGSKLILSKKYKSTSAATVFNSKPYLQNFMSHRFFDIETNKMLAPFYFKDNKIIDGSRSVKKIKRVAKEEKTLDFPLVYKDGFFMFERVKGYRSLKDMKSLKAFDLDKKQKWEYVFNPNNEAISYNFMLLNKEDIVFRTFNKKTKKEKLHSLNPQTGEPIFVYEVENKSSKYSHSYTIETTKDRIVIIGKISPYKSSSGYDFEKSLGFFRIELDKQGNELSKKYVTWEQLANFIEIKKNGKLKGGYRLAAREYFVFENNTVSILTEKSKKDKTTDFVVLNLDENFSLVSTKVFKKEKDRFYSSDYLFSQKIKDGNGVAFFYKHYTKNKAKGKIVLMGGFIPVKQSAREWTLGIVTIINGEINQEEIPMTSEEHVILPYVAKKGYILLREFNKDSDYDQIRLEQLNY
ncbi:DUF6770 family protein [uncultured Tenacibaculum sp.]|uniref:DUF6770 family protein n=1 Tax=uncultured Tenacibaculum sp. TaxID=174713 RepID=UPI00260B00E4|nr:DUF6770 family protein [uncultured Tenacibaculum sp.]